MDEVAPHTRMIVKRDVGCINGKLSAQCVPSSVLRTALLLSMCLRMKVQEGLHSRSTDPASRWRRSQVLLWLLVSRHGMRCGMWEEAHHSWAQRRKRRGPTGSCLYHRTLLTGEMCPQTCLQLSPSSQQVLFSWGWQNLRGQESSVLLP